MKLFEWKRKPVAFLHYPIEHKGDNELERLSDSLSLKRASKKQKSPLASQPKDE